MSPQNIPAHRIMVALVACLINWICFVQEVEGADSGSKPTVRICDPDRKDYDQVQKEACLSANGYMNRIRDLEDDYEAEKEGSLRNIVLNNETFEGILSQVGNFTYEEKHRAGQPTVARIVPELEGWQEALSRFGAWSGQNGSHIEGQVWDQIGKFVTSTIEELVAHQKNPWRPKGEVQKDLDELERLLKQATFSFEDSYKSAYCASNLYAYDLEVYKLFYQEIPDDNTFKKDKKFGDLYKRILLDKISLWRLRLSRNTQTAIPLPREIIEQVNTLCGKPRSLAPKRPELISVDVNRRRELTHFNTKN